MTFDFEKFPVYKLALNFTKADKKNFYIIARGSVFECVAIIDILRQKGIINETLHSNHYKILEELSKMTSGLINSQK